MTQVNTPVTMSGAANRAVRAWRGVPPWALIVIAIVSVQLGAAAAKQLFDTAGPTGVVFLRTAISSLIFMVMFRPALRHFRRPSWPS